MAKTGIVVDSTCDLEPGFYKDKDVVMVPLTTRFGDEQWLDWTELKPGEFFRRLRKVTELPKTSQPTVAQFQEAYSSLSQTCDAVISLHLSSKTSGTIQSAAIAAKEVGIPVEIIDTEIISGGIALILDKLLDMRSQGETFKAMVDTAKKMVHLVKCIGGLSTIKYVEMGGRIGKATAFLGTLLDFKPILTFSEGEVAAVKRVRGVRMLIPEMINLIKNEIRPGNSIVIVMAHGDNTEMLDEFKRKLKDTGITVKKSIETMIGSVIGTYAGPDSLLVFFYQPEEL